MVELQAMLSLLLTKIDDGDDAHGGGCNYLQKMTMSSLRNTGSDGRETNQRYFLAEEPEEGDPNNDLISWVVLLNDSLRSHEDGSVNQSQHHIYFI